MHIAVLIDKNMLPGLHVTLYSCLAHWDYEEPLDIHLFHYDFGPNDLDLIEKTLSLTGRPYRFHTREFSLDRLRLLKPFHGSLAPYGALLLPDLLPEVSSVLYLDSDVLFTLPFSKFLEQEAAFSCYPVAAALSSTFDSTLDRGLAITLGLDLNAPYFNSGVLVLNLEQWRRDNLAEQCIAFCREHGGYDQTALNVIFYKSFFVLPHEFNYPLYAGAKGPAEVENKILHFVGSPKPFDFLGNTLNANSALFNAVLAKTAFANYNPNAISRQKLRRVYTLRRSYLRSVRDCLVNAISSQTHSENGS